MLRNGSIGFKRPKGATPWGWEMLVRSVSRSPIVLLAVLFLFAGASQALADQVTLSYIDANANAKTIVLDCNTSSED